MIHIIYHICAANPHAQPKLACHPLLGGAGGCSLCVLCTPVTLAKCIGWASAVCINFAEYALTVCKILIITNLSKLILHMGIRCSLGPLRSGSFKILGMDGPGCSEVLHSFSPAWVSVPSEMICGNVIVKCRDRLRTMVLAIFLGKFAHYSESSESSLVAPHPMWHRGRNTTVRTAEAPIHH